MKLLKQTPNKKIVIVVTVASTARSFAAGFARYVAHEGFEVYILASGLEHTVENLGRGSVTTVPIQMERNPSIARDLKSLYLLLQAVRKIQPSVMLYGTPKASLLGSIVGFVLRVPNRVYQLWGLRLETVGGFKQRILWLMELITSILSTRVLANSPSLARKFKQLGLSPYKQVDVLGSGSSHGVDLRKFSVDQEVPDVQKKSPTVGNSEPAILTIGFVGRLHPDKGINILLDAARILRKEGVPFQLLIVGGDEGAALDLTHIEKEVLLIGRVSDTRPYYAAMDVLVLPSFREGFPNVVLEAASMLVPAIVSDGTGVVDSVIDNETGFIVPVGNPGALAKALKKLYSDPLCKHELGLKARRRVENEFKQEDVWSRTLGYSLRNIH